MNVFIGIRIDQILIKFKFTGGSGGAPGMERGFE